MEQYFYLKTGTGDVLPDLWEEKGSHSITHYNADYRAKLFIRQLKVMVLYAPWL